MTKAEKLEEQLRIERVKEEIHNNLANLKMAKKWVDAEDGETIGHGCYPVEMKGVSLDNAFMGYGTGGGVRLTFPSIKRHTGVTITSKLIDALIEIYEQELTKDV